MSESKVIGLHDDSGTEVSDFRDEMHELGMAVRNLADFVDRMEMTSYLGGRHYTVWWDNLQKLIGMRTRLEELEAKVAYADYVKRQSLVPYRIAS
ncbi:hypothetical protein [Nocardia sp. CA-290969]|uniref:hypothetical protein n=1 Tax=Nocardia sp. CA-290969 TaxID=3239986 RepID=UPI003D948F4D